MYAIQNQEGFFLRFFDRQIEAQDLCNLRNVDNFGLAGVLHMESFARPGLCPYAAKLLSQSLVRHGENLRP
jgi:hypothetical protein